jgi:hypothetical protein
MRPVFILLAIFANSILANAQQKDSLRIDSLQGGVILLEGNYQGKNLYIQNPFAGHGMGFCVTKVFVNGIETKDEIESSAFEIDLSVYGLKVGDKITVKILHKADCKPRVLNPDHGPRKSTFETKKISAEPSGLLEWTTENETGKLPFVIEQFRWNKWIKVGEVEGKGGAQENEYKFMLAPHSGENQARVKQVDYITAPHYSRPIKFTSTVPVVKLKSKVISKELEFDAETLYEIYDKYGSIVKRGYGKVVDCSRLPNDVYFLNFDNTTTEFKKNAKPIAIYSQKRAVSPSSIFTDVLHLYHDSTIILLRYNNNNSSFAYYDGKIKRTGDSTYSFTFTPVVIYEELVRTPKDSVRFSVHHPGDMDQKHHLTFNYSGKKDTITLRDGEKKIILPTDLSPGKEIEVNSGMRNPFSGKDLWLHLDASASGTLTFYELDAPAIITTAILRKETFILKGKTGTGLNTDMNLKK